MASIPIFGSPSSGEVSISPGTAHGIERRSSKVIHLLSLLAVLLFPTTARAALAIDAKAVKTESNMEEEIWVIRISLKNTGNTPFGPLVIQYRRSGFSEFEPDGRPTTGKLDHTEGTIKQEVSVIPAGQQVTVDSPRMNFAGPGNLRKLAQGMIQSIRVRAWQNGNLVGEFAEKDGKAADADWPLNPPAVPEGAESGSGPWLLLKKDGADFSGISLGASATDVLKMLKTHGPGKIDAKPEPFHGLPLRMSSADLPGVIFGFDAAKKLSAIEITDASRIKLPSKLILGRSNGFDAVFGPGTQPAPLPVGATDAWQYQLKDSRLTMTSAASGIAPTALLEKTP